jgi:succinate-acetate transporter protein
MRIRINLADAKNVRWHECAIRFAFGGLITVIAGMVAEKWGPKAGGVLLAFPAIFPASATLLQKHQ